MPNRIAEREPSTLRVLIVEDHSVLREVLEDLCWMQGDIEVCGVAESAENGLRLLEECRPNIALVDLSLPGMSGIQFTEAARQVEPELCCLILTGHKEREYARQAVRAGASGYILKGRPLEIIPAIRRAVRGERVFSPGMEVR